MINKTKHFYTTSNFSLKEIREIISLALQLKQVYVPGKLMADKRLLMLFFNPSLRTRLSFIAAMDKLGGQAVDFPLSSSYPFEYKEGVVMDGVTMEHVKDAVKVMSGYSDAIAVRASKLITSESESVKSENWSKLKEDTVINSFMQYASVPVINMESNVWHPCQGMADAMTMVESLSARGENFFAPQLARDLRPYINYLQVTRSPCELQKFSSVSLKNVVPSLVPPVKNKYVLTWVPHSKALPMATPNSQMLSACELGMDVTVVHPLGWELDKEILDIAQKTVEKSGGSLNISNNQNEALRGAKFVCAKSWSGMKYFGDWGKEKEVRGKYKDWIVDKAKMNLTKDAYFMHCLPVRRNVEVTDEVLDSRNSLIYKQAENRMWVQMAILLFLFEFANSMKSCSR
ncbi:hypothetical protein M1271_00380 [Patescibacteria group bacterium]|nr:hypothetical protein [Patescibacteria group bacterium]